MKSIKFTALLYFFIAISTVNANDYQISSDFHVHSKIMKARSEFMDVRPAYVSAFLNAYNNHSAQSLNLNDKAQFLDNYFSEDEQDLYKPGFYPIKIMDTQQNLVSYISLDNIDEIRMNDSSRVAEFANLPKNSLYIRNLFVDQMFARKGIGSLMLNEIIHEFAPNTRHIYVATRRINQPAINLYQKCGFTICDENLHNLSAKQYISLEKHSIN